MKRVIYTINAYPLPARNKEKLPYATLMPNSIRAIGPWEKLPLEHFHHYAKEVEADFYQITEESIPSLCLPPALHGYQECNMLKFYIFHHFVNSNYDNMLYLDLDILIKKDAKNIFNCIKGNGIHMTISGDKEQIHANKYWLENNFKVNSDVPFYNGGIVYADRKSITDFYQKVPQLGEWQQCYKKYNLHKNCTSDNNIRFNEQNWLSFFFHEQNIEIKELSQNWNSPVESQHEKDDFIHYYGPEGKRRLIQ